MFAVLHDEQGLDVVVHVLEAVQIEVRAPYVAVEQQKQKRWEERRRVLGQLLHNVCVPEMEHLRAEVIAISARR